MTEYRLTDERVPTVSTGEFHADRERARHLEDPIHRGRLTVAAELVRHAVSLRRGREWGSDADPVTVSDLGCGDGGLLSLLAGEPGLVAWGYDFCPANAAGWAERDVNG